MYNNYQSNIKILNTFNLLTLSQHLGHLSSKLLKLFRRQRHFHFHVLGRLNLKNNFRSKNFVDCVSAQNNINFPLTISEIQFSMSLLEILDFVLFGVFKIEFGSVLISWTDSDILIWILIFANLWSKSLFFVVG